MNWLYISPFSISVLNVAVLLSFMITFLMQNKQKSTPTKLMIGFLAGVLVVFFSFVLIFSSVDPWVTTVAWWLLHIFVFSAVSMVQFAYYFSTPFKPKEAKVAFYVTLAASCIAYPFYIYKTLNMDPMFNFDGGFYVFTRTPEIGIVIGLEIGWMLFVFVRKIVHLSEHKVDKVPASYGFIKRTWCSLKNSFLKYVYAKGKEARVLKKLSLIFITPIILIIFIVMAYLGMMSWEIVAHVLGTGFMIFAFIFVTLYINNSSEPSTFLIKLIGISLGSILVVFGFGASITLSIKDAAYTENKKLEIEHVKKIIKSGDYRDIPLTVSYLLSHEGKNEFKPLYIKKNEYKIKDLKKIEEGDLEELKDGEMLRGFVKFDELEPKAYHIFYRFFYMGEVHEIGYSYQKYRKYMHTTAMPLIWLIIVAVVFIVVVFPYFFNQSLIKPLNELLRGVKAVDDGDLKVSVPVYVPDEVGYITNSFNNMVKSIDAAKTKLKIAFDDQVKLTDAYSCFVPKSFLHFLEKENIVEVKLGDHVQTTMSVLFSDIRSFTEISEKMTPKENFEFLNNYLGRIGPVVRKYNGFVDKYIGDAIMALFPDSAESSLNAAIAMQSELRKYNKTLSEGRDYQKIRSGIGIHTGELMLGTIGEEKRMEGTVISDAVNLSSRMEGLSKVYGVSIIASFDTVDSLTDKSKYNYRFLDRVRVKGKDKSVDIYDMFDGDEDKVCELKASTKDKFEQAVKLYLEMKNKEALTLFKEVSLINKDDISARLYISRCEDYLKHGVPEGWNGVTVFDFK